VPYNKDAPAWIRYFGPIGLFVLLLVAAGIIFFKVDPVAKKNRAAAAKAAQSVEKAKKTSSKHE